MNTLVNVGRYHLVDRFTWLALPWGIMAFSFLVNIGVALSVPVGPRGIYTGGWCRSTSSCSSAGR